MFNINGPSGPTSRNERSIRPQEDKRTAAAAMKRSVARHHAAPLDRDVNKENACVSTLFQGCNFYFNGHTGNVSSYNLIKMVKAHGGNTSIVHRKTRVTHVIATNLSGSKTDAVLRSGGRVHCVHPQWIVDSIEKGKRQPEAKYVVCKDFTVSSSGMTFFTPSIVPQASKPPTRSLS
ncbi:hypothetical protein H310_08754 [Aphanomyces invadans]|uniref:BRCT domain-containing protein n=1 Tax=Aphanomyces invadans TaxID=157072 RepID=A0A024TZ45_9STRA|nr:hypothetical protein H310_08754 [Aphanomyces invadans]ETV98637.1 hypothetical protein H310_08754 [Aphanomyces invadans]|eukprot:XP_008872834.1 hypothetical protein H310_08754 [Aphanomyces invadans]